MSGTAANRKRLDPTARDRARALLRGSVGPRMATLRKVLALMLAASAGVLMLLPQPGSAAGKVPVLAAAHDLAPGRTLESGDVRVLHVPGELVPEGALTAGADIAGRTLAAAAPRGQILTDVSLAGTALTRLATGHAGHAAVPIRLSDPAVAELLHPGRRVDVVAASAKQAEVLATRVPVVTVRAAGKQRERGALVVVGLPPAKAAEVAAASLTRSVTVTLR